MPRCFNCNYPRDEWLSPEPCPECGVIPHQHIRPFWTSRQRVLAIVCVFVFITGNTLFGISIHNPFTYDGIADILKVHPDTISLATLFSIFIAPSLLIYLILDGFNRGLSKKYSVILSLISLIPVFVCTMFLHIILGSIMSL
jgi:hypothetical protein